MKKSVVSMLVFLAITGTFSQAGAANAMTVGCNFWNIGWEGTSDFFKNGVNWATETNPWNPTFLTDCAPYSCLRFMDWCAPLQGNNPGVWSTRTKKTDNQNQSAPSGAVAYEWMIDLANRLNKDMWICIPTLADTNYANSLAQLIHSQLNSPLKVYVEYTNETWNYDATYYQNKGAALGLNGTTAEMQGYSYTVYQAVRMWEQFEKVFGKDSPRLVKALCGNASSIFVVNQNLVALADTVKINPHKVKCNVFGIAPYMRGANVTENRAQLTAKYGEARSHYGRVNPKGIKVVCYEAGFETATGAAIATDPAVYQLYKDFLDTLSKGGVNGPCNVYTAVGATSGYQWGLKAYTGQPNSEAHKYRAVVDWVGANPVGVVEPATYTIATPASRVSPDWIVDLQGRRLAPGLFLHTKSLSEQSFWIIDKLGAHRALTRQ